MSVMNSPPPKNAQKKNFSDELSFLNLKSLQNYNCYSYPVWCACSLNIKIPLLETSPINLLIECMAVQKRDWHQLSCMACGDAPSPETPPKTIMMSCPGKKMVILFKCLIVMPNECMSPSHLERMCDSHPRCTCL